MEDHEIESLKRQAAEANAALGAALAPQARELAEQFADENEVGIDQVCVMASPTGDMQAIVMR